MKRLSISKFKATCLSVLEQVRKTKRPVLVTRFGSPFAKVVPPSAQTAEGRTLGTLEGSITIDGDIVHATPWLESERPARRRK